ncbi:MAG: polysaccharide deacetylase family protein [Hyphomicrobiaceae bacterium]
MISIAKNAARRAVGVAAAAVVVPVMVLAASVPAAAQGLLNQCWSPAELAGQPSEKPPRPHARGAAQRIPDLRLARFAPVPPTLRGSIRRVTLPKGQKLVALTFDLCEQSSEISGYDGAIVDYLRANEIHATFFAGGKWLLTHGERAQQLIADPRFEMANHGWAHRNVRGLDPVALEGEVVGPQRAYEQARSKLASRQCIARTPAAMRNVAPRLTLYRFPYGACNPQALATLANNGLLAVQWDVSAGDATRVVFPETVARNVLGSVRPGSIVLMHANGRGYNTGAALKILIPKLKARGFRMVTVTELLAAGQPVITPTCYDHRLGDTDRYDRLFQVRKGTRHGSLN